MHTKEQEKTGELILLVEVIIFSLFPIVINHSSKLIPPILFAGLSILTAGIFMTAYSLATKKTKEIYNKQGLKYSLLVTLFIIIIPSLLIYPGTKLTSGINTTIFFQIETFSALLFCSIFLKEKITKLKLAGSLLIGLGAISVLYNGNFQINIGDILIIIGTAIYPIGNIFAKKGLKHISPSTIIMIRSILGGTILILISIIFENTFGHITQNFTKALPYILLNGILIMGISKILWYEGLKRMEVSKATALTMTYPAFSIALAFILLKETPTPYQILGLIVIMLGAVIIVKSSRKTHKLNILHTANTP